MQYTGKIKHLEIYGDSILRGVTYSADSGRYGLCRKNRFAELSDEGITAKNNSRMGATVARGLQLLRQNLSSDAADTVVVLEYGGNDCDYPWAEVSGDPRGTFSPNIPEEQYACMMREAVEYTRSRGAVPVIASLVPIDAEKYMNWITKNRSYENILAWLGDVSMLSRWQEQYSRRAERLAYETGTKLLDLRRAFLLSHNYKSLLCADGIHPTEEGHALIDSTVRDFCRGMI